MKNHQAKKVISLIAILALCGSTTFAQKLSNTKALNNKGKFTLLTGITQPLLLNGGNIAFNYGLSDRIILEGSFGFGLSYKNLLTDEEEALYEDIENPLTGGFGIGYVPVRNLVLMWEPKFTMYKITPLADKSFQYTTFTAGIGAYYNIYLYKGLMIQPAIKYWPKIGSTLSGDETTFQTGEGMTEMHEARTPGNDGLIYNISIGWTFGRK